MRVLAIALTLALSAGSAIAAGFSVDLPHLSWPQDDQTTSSTKGCTAAPKPAIAVCK